MTEIRIPIPKIGLPSLSVGFALGLIIAATLMRNSLGLLHGGAALLWPFSTTTFITGIVLSIIASTRRDEMMVFIGVLTLAAGLGMMGVLFWNPALTGCHL
jgi:hypothetical protein